MLDSAIDKLVVVLQSPSVVSRYANRAAQLGIKAVALTYRMGWYKTKTYVPFRPRLRWRSTLCLTGLQYTGNCVINAWRCSYSGEEYCERNPGGFTAITITAGCTVNGSKPLHHQCVRYIKLAKNFRWLLWTYRWRYRPWDRRNKNCSGHRSCSQGIKLHMGRGRRSQQLEDWVMSHVRCFQWLGGVPELVVPDNLKSATSGAYGHDLTLTTYQQMLEHYNVAVLPCAARKPKDKAKAEVGVQIYWTLDHGPNQAWDLLQPCIA